MFPLLGNEQLYQLVLDELDEPTLNEDTSGDVNTGDDVDTGGDVDELNSVFNDDDGATNLTATFSSILLAFTMVKLLLF